MPAGWLVAVGGGVVALGAAFGTRDARGAALFGAGSVVLILGLLLPVARAFRRYLTGPPSWRRCAERLDLAAGTQNRIATALTLLRAERTPFMDAAIEQGLRSVRQVAGVAPWHRYQAFALRWLRGPLATLIALSAIALVARSGSGGDSPPGADSRTAAPQRAAPRAAADSAEGVSAAAAIERPVMSGQRTERGVDSAQPPDAARGDVETVAGGTGSGGTVGQPADTSVSAAAGGADDARGAAASESSAQRGGAARDVRTSGQATIRGTGAATSADARAARAIAPGAAAAGDARAMASGSGSGSAAVDDAERPAEAGESETGPTTESAQRGGARVMLPDRRQAPSRDLGISGPTGGRPGTGRGGPSPVKKSRGTGALVMGIPVPDFLRGQLGPGPTAVRYERTWPESAGALHPGGPVPPTREVAEGHVQPFVVPWDEAETVRRYLEQWHHPAGVVAQGAAAENSDDDSGDDVDEP